MDNETLYEAWYFSNNPSLPFTIREILGIKDGDKYRFVKKNGEIVIEKTDVNYFK